MAVTVDLTSQGYGVTTVGALVEKLRGAYQGTIGVQLTHVSGSKRRAWLRGAIEERAASMALPRERKQKPAAE